MNVYSNYSLNLIAAYDTSWPGLQINSTDLPKTEINIDERPCGCLLDCTVYRYPVDSTNGILDKAKFYGDRSFL